MKRLTVWVEAVPQLYPWGEVARVTAGAVRKTRPDLDDKRRFIRVSIEIPDAVLAPVAKATIELT